MIEDRKMNFSGCMLISLSLIVLNSSIALAEDVGSHEQQKILSEIKKSELKLTLPNIQMIRQDGKKVQFSDEINDGRVVVVSFIYTSCSAICPMISQTIYKLQTKLGADIGKVHLVSISIDPEHDTPKQLAAYAEKVHAGKYWQHYTGTEEASITIQKAMGVYRGDKMSHAPVTFLKGGKGDVWVRVDGFATADDLLSEYKELASVN
jgi:protein SCO1/2